VPGNAYPAPHLIAWEITRTCNLYCAHCRASAGRRFYEGELSTAECLEVIDSILEVGRPILILSGGEPLLRKDFFTLARYAVGKGLRVVAGSNGTEVTPEVALEMKQVPISRLAISIDFPTPSLQDSFRGLPGAFQAAIKGIEYATKAGVEVQLNSTITTQNVTCLEQLLALSLELGVVAFHPFLLVPTGRGKELEKEELPAEEYERVLNWIYDKQAELEGRITMKPTCAPHYMRVARQRGWVSPSKGDGGGMNRFTRGCLVGSGFCFISHRGQVQGCGYLDRVAGNVREQSFGQIWWHSPLFQELRDLDRLKGKCGLCEFKKVCGGCRARAYELTGDYLAEEPYCVYEPHKGRSGLAVGSTEGGTGC
jgi:heme b synthase